jgi:hypothetical protein
MNTTLNRKIARSNNSNSLFRLRGVIKGILRNNKPLSSLQLLKAAITMGTTTLRFYPVGSQLFWKEMWANLVFCIVAGFSASFLIIVMTLFLTPVTTWLEVGTVFMILGIKLGGWLYFIDILLLIFLSLRNKQITIFNLRSEIFQYW